MFPYIPFISLYDNPGIKCFNSDVRFCHARDKERYTYHKGDIENDMVWELQFKRVKVGMPQTKQEGICRG